MSAARKQFDWRAIHLQLDRRLSRIGTTLEDDAGRTQAILKQRSLQLAVAPADRQANADLHRMLVFRASGERYGLALRAAHEIAPLSRIALVPDPDAGLLGIVNWRGEFVVVFATERLFGLGRPAKDPARRVIVLSGPEPRMGLAVDDVERIAGVDLARLQAPDRLRSREPGLFKGATPDAVFVLDEERLLERLKAGLRAT